MAKVDQSENAIIYYHPAACNGDRASVNLVALAVLPAQSVPTRLSGRMIHGLKVNDRNR